MEPVAPVAPVGPVAPVAPVAPVGPVGPVTPVTPVTPVGPVGPVGPGVNEILVMEVLMLVSAAVIWPSVGHGHAKPPTVAFPLENSTSDAGRPEPMALASPLMVTASAGLLACRKLNTRCNQPLANVVSALVIGATQSGSDCEYSAAIRLMVAKPAEGGVTVTLPTPSTMAAIHARSLTCPCTDVVFWRLVVPTTQTWPRLSMMANSVTANGPISTPPMAAGMMQRMSS